ncbi:hypothetical protein BUE80_DR013125 [Diplocarpon rosae]|nr:hypothetical protein BUE80_DR013125 [Diplocarpon rosae]
MSAMELDAPVSIAERFIAVDQRKKNGATILCCNCGAAIDGTTAAAFEVEYVVAYQQCPDCAKSYTANTWRACVQVRQKVPHKRTFLFLEQLILKHGAHKDTINIKEVKDLRN